MKTLIYIDRDGTINYDDRYFLGSQKDWKKKIEILPGVVEGIQKLRKISDVDIYIITNQSGVAIKEFPLLTEKRANEVCKEIIHILKNQGAEIDGYYVCPHVPPSYTEKRKQYTFDEKLVCNCLCIKPNLGMVFESLRKQGINEKDAHIYVIGDRESDVQTGINIKGTGVLVPFKNLPDEEKKVKKLKKEVKKMKGDIYIAKNFLDAAKFIVKKEK